ncbi:hypothetical protein KEJ26_00870 [Candidatus Bathyarchaeota archaeon]|nr:hypothetical protein [Candidatus Bathyarchaeota archaeon]
MSTTTPSPNFEKPFWLQPPWMILFDIIRLHRLRPWDVNLSYLLNSLLSEMRKRGYIDFTASGIALLSSATIYRMKTELILKLEEPPTPPPPKVAEVLPPPIQLPIRYEYTTTSVEQLIRVLDEVLKAEPTLPRSGLKPITPAPPVLQQLDQFIVEIEKHIERMYNRIAEMAVKDNLVAFSKLVTGLKRLEVVRVFLIILFLACRGKINLWQEQEFGEIYISLPGGSPVGSQAVGIV